jgi:hypothetical protein
MLTSDSLLRKYVHRNDNLPNFVQRLLSKLALLLLLEDVGADDVVVAGDDGRRGFAI